MTSTTPTTAKKLRGLPDIGAITQQEMDHRELEGKKEISPSVLEWPLSGFSPLHVLPDLLM